MAYASAMGANPAAIYRRIDVAGRIATADGPTLVEFLYDELIAALRAAAYAVEHGQWSVRSERVMRATAILFALEAGLDFDRGGDVAPALAQLYGSARARIVDASLGHDPAVFRDIAAQFADIAGAWRAARVEQKVAA